jgi:hypothetical protein
MGNRISKAIIASVAAMLLAASALAIAEPVAAQWRDGPGWQGGGRSRGELWLPEAPWGPAVVPGASAPHSSGPYWSDSCWQVRSIYSTSGTWLDNRRVNVCY